MSMSKLNLKWFKDRIGKRVYRTGTSCDCEICNCVVSQGLIIKDNIHAMYLNDIYHDFNAEGDYIMYYDTLEERNKDPHHK